MATDRDPRGGPHTPRQLSPAPHRRRVFLHVFQRNDDKVEVSKGNSRKQLVAHDSAWRGEDGGR